MSKVQTSCLRRITGTYKSVSGRVLEHGTDTLPIDLYLQQLRIQHAVLSATQPVQAFVRSQTEEEATSSEKRRIPQREMDIIRWKELTGIQVDTEPLPTPGPKQMGNKFERRKKVKALREALCRVWKERWETTRPSRQTNPTAAQPRLWNASGASPVPLVTGEHSLETPQYSPWQPYKGPVKHCYTA